jgi:outer membrane receptor protein involved in Fe transport
MSVITRDELRRFGGTTLGEILDRVPGLTLSTASFTDRSLIAARGDQTQINGGHILFLINGRPTREILEGGLIGDLLESFPVEILERIEVIRGPGSVLYGSNAYSAVVNLITRKADGEEVEVSGLGGGGRAIASAGEVLLRHGDLSVVGAGQFHQEPDWIAPVSTPYGPEQAVIPYRSKGAYFETDYKGLSLMSSYTEYNTDYLEGLVGEGRWRRGFTDLGYKVKASATWDMNFDLTYTRATLDAKYYIPFITRVSNDALAEWTNTLALTNKDHLTFGTLYDYISGQEDFFGESPMMVISQGRRPGGAFYGQLEHQLLDSVALIGGFQANKIGGIGLNVVPRGGLIWKPASQYSVKLLYSGAFRAPSLSENFMDYVPPANIGGPGLKGNPGLSPETVATIDLALSYQGKRLQGELGYFHSKQSNDIILANATVAGEYVNQGEITFQGGELEGNYYLGKHLFLKGSALYQVNDGGSSLTPIPNASGKAGISYQDNKLIVSLFDAYEGPVSGYAGALNPKPGAYSLLNGQLRYDLSKYMHAGPHTPVALVVHGENLANRAVWLPDWKDVPGDSIFYNRGRTVYFGIEVGLKKE